MRRCRNLCLWPVNIGIVSGDNRMPFRKERASFHKPLAARAEEKESFREATKVRADLRKDRQKVSPKEAKLITGLPIGLEGRQKGWTSAFSTISKASVRAIVKDRITAQF